MRGVARRHGEPARWTPKRGDAAWIDLNPQAGSEQTGRRRVLIVSPGAAPPRRGRISHTNFSHVAQGPRVPRLGLL